ncbi:MAG: amino acid adenylation domain-containing protein [Phormidesmis sp.]
MKNVADIYPLSPVQLGMLFHTLAETEDAAAKSTKSTAGTYINQYTCKLVGELDVANFQQAWQLTIAQHPVLRTAFLWEGLDQPLQVVRQNVKLPWQQLDWREIPTKEQAEKLETLLSRDRTRAFNLAKAPILRLVLIQLNETRFQLVWSFHHLLFDGWSLPLIWQDMLTCYQSLCAKEPAQFEERRPYRDFIAWQQNRTDATAESFWRSQLSGFSEPTPLPAAITASGEATDAQHIYQQHSRQIDSNRTAQIKQFAKAQRLTLSTLIQSAWALMLSHYSGAKQVTYGSVVSGRPAELSGIERIVGMFISTLPVCVSVPAEQPLSQWLQACQQQFLDLRQHDTTPLPDIKRWSQLPAESPLFESIVVFENYPEAQPAELTLIVEDSRYLEQSNYPLALLVVPGQSPNQSIELLCIYDSARFEAGAINRLLAHVELLLKAFIEQPEQTLAELPRLTPDEQQQMADKQPVHYPQDLAVHQLIEAQALKTPNAEAVVFGTASLSYAALNQQANRLAHELRSHGVTPGSRVCICLNRSPAIIVSILAVLKAGAAYVPLDPDYPTARLAYCLEDTAPKVICTDRATAQSAQLPNEAIPRLYLDEFSFSEEDSRTLADRSDLSEIDLSETDLSEIKPDDLAYIIYTSGSTGKPKGVMVSHQNLMHSTAARTDFYPDAVKRFLLLSSVAFDSSIAGIFWTLVQGGTLVMAPQRIEQDLQQLAGLIESDRITHTLCVPTLYSLLIAEANPQSLSTLKVVIVAGEACSRTLVRSHYAKLPHTHLYNEYGPTEATVWCAGYRIPSDLPPGPVAIGHAIANTHLWLLDANQRRVPTGAIGEIYVGGDGVAHGYLNQPEKTAAAFVSLSSGEAGESAVKQPQRFYETGDLGRYRADGTLEWLGRSDRQVKIRGHRIELGEIEEALRSHPSVQEAVVTQAAIIQTAPDDGSIEHDSMEHNSIEALVKALSALPKVDAIALLSAVESAVELAVELAIEEA